MKADRRNFLTAAGAVAVTAAAFPPASLFAKTTNPNAVKLELFAQGEILVDPGMPIPVLFPGPPPAALAQLGSLPPGAAKIIVTNQLAGNLFNVNVRLANGPNSLNLFPPDGIPISDFDTEIEAVTLGGSGGQYDFAAMGKVVKVTVPSPFGELVGRAAAFGAEFDTPGETTNFSFFGGFVAGSHATWTITAAGRLLVNPSPSFL